jgi:EAL domain-containing protein (putative c-di-GMP-specific phosphodiesterase class I)
MLSTELPSQRQISTEAIAFSQLIACIAKATSEGEIYNRVVDFLPEIIPSQRVSFNLLDSSSQDLEVIALRGIAAQMPTGTKISSDRLLSAKTLETKQSQIETTDLQSNFVDSIQLAQSEISTLISAPLIVDGQAIGTIDVGVCVSEADALKIDRIMVQLVSSIANRLENNLKKEQTSNNINNILEPKTSELTNNKLTIENYLKNAIANDELHLVFQPQIDTMTGQVEGLEALLRWEHPVLGKVSPAIFIPIAEQSNLIKELTSWVLDRSLQVLKELHRDYPNLYMAVNISPCLFASLDALNQEVSTLLIKYKLSGRFLELEIPERILQKDTAKSAQTLANVRMQGVRIAIDDFGSGFSSLTYLADLPIDTLKIDRSFTKDIDTDPRKRGIMGGVVAIARSLEIQCIAEGVESPTQLMHLASLGCHQCQGFFFGHPMKLEELPPILQRKM